MFVMSPGLVPPNVQKHISFHVDSFGFILTGFKISVSEIYAFTSVGGDYNFACCAHSTEKLHLNTLNTRYLFSK